MSFRKVMSAAIATGAVLAAMAAPPAGAHNGPASCVLLQSPAEVNNVEMGPPSVSGNPMSKATAGHAGQKVGLGNRFGLYYPVTDPLASSHAMPGPNNNPYAGTGVLPATVGDNFNWKQTGSCTDTGVSYNAGGSAIGYCGRSIGYGTGSIAGHSTIIRWESFGTQLILVDATGAGTPQSKVVVGSVNAQAAPPGTPTGSCLDGGATVFVVDGALVHM